MELVFSRGGFTDGYLTGKKGDNMFGTKTDVPLESVKYLYDEAAKRFAEGKEMPLVPINMVCDTHPKRYFTHCNRLRWKYA